MRKAMCRDRKSKTELHSPMGGRSIVLYFRAGILAFFCLALLFSPAISEAAAIWTHDFETSGGYTASGTEFTDGTGTDCDYFLRTDGSDICSNFSVSNVVGTYFFAAQDFDASVTSPATITFDDINISGYSSIVLYIYLAEDDDGANQDWDASDYFHIDYDIDNTASFTDLLHVESDLGTNGEPLIDTDFDGTGDGTALTSTFTEFNASIPGTGSLIDLKLTFAFGAGDEDIAIDHIRLVGTSSCTAPTSQPTGISFASITDNGMTVNWSGNGDGDGRIVVVKAGSAVSATPSNGTAHSASTVFGSGADLGTSEYVVYRSTGSSVAITGLATGTTYHYAIFEYNNTGDCYFLTSPLTGNQATTCTAPTTQASVVTFSSVTASTMDIGWTRGNGDGVLVVVKSGSAVDADPSDGGSYTANTAFGSGTQIGTGNYVVYDGTGTSVSITGLTSATTYHVAVYEYTNAGACYNATEVTGSQLTLSAPCISDGFESGEPASWTNNSSYYNSGTAYAGSNKAGMNTTGDWIKTTQETNPNVLTFWIRASGATSNFTMIVETSPDNSVWTTKATYAADGSNSGTITDTYSQKTVNISLTGDYYIRFKISVRSGGSCYLDDVELSCSAVCTIPTTQATSFSTNTVTTTSMNFAFTRGNGDGGVMVVAKAGSAPADPTSGTTYTTNAAYGSGDPCGGGFVVYNGTASGTGAATGNLPITGLATNTTYHFAVYEYNTTGTCYDITELTGNATTLCDDPTTDATSISFASVTSTSLTINWTDGNGSNRIVVVKAGSAVDSDPVDGTGYTANTAFGSGTQIGTGNYVVYNSTGSSVAITGLSAEITYHVAIYEFNSGTNCYKTTSSLIDNQATPCPGSVDPVTSITNSAANTQATISWTNPANCFDEIMVICDDGTVGTVPSGDGTAYTANAVYGSGTNTQGNEYVVYKGTGTSVITTGLTNGTSYCFKIWARQGTTWSASATKCSVIPKILIPDNDCGGNDATLTEIYSGGSIISDVNFTVQIEHSNRADIVMELESPSGTIVQIMDGNDGSTADNLHATFDDESGTASMPTTNHTLGGAVDIDCQPVAGVSLSDFDGESPNGTWTLRVCDDAGSAVGYLLDFSLDITNTCVPAHTVTSFGPTSGPEYTLVTIVGTGFTGSSTVTFDGTAAASVVFVDATTLIAEVPSGCTTGYIVVTESACAVSGVGTFMVLGQYGTCFSGPSGMTNLYISEIYDAGSGSIAYLEIYNGTGSTISLIGDSIRRHSDGVGGANTHTYLFPPSGVGSTIASGEVLVGGIGTGASSAIYDFLFNWVCHTDPSVDDSPGTFPWGFNKDDVLDFYEDGVFIDRFDDGDAGGNNGYTYKRLTTPTPPTTTFNSSHWTYSSTESTSDLGNVGSSPVTPPSISAEPTDVSSCTITCSVTAAAGNSGTLSYQWLYNDGSSASWANVTAGAFAPATVAGETSASLSISGTDTEDWDGYQFYCEVLEDGLCGIVSDAVQFTAESETYFRSNVSGSGSWTSASSWQMATSGSGPWTDACSYPDYTNSDYIHILSGDVLNITADITLDQVEIESGGTIDIAVAAKVTLNDGTGIDLQVDGILIDNNVSLDQIVWNGSSVWSMGSAGTLIKTNSSSVGNYKTNYSGGISTIPASGTWIYRYTGVATVISTAAVDMYYPNLTFESTSGFWDFSHLNSKLKGGSGYCRVLGDMDIGGSGGGTVKVYNINTNATKMTISGDLDIQTGSTLINDDGSTIGTGFDVNGDVTIDGTLTINSTGVFEFSGVGTQTVSGSGVNAITNGLINNSSAGGIVITNATIDINISTTLFLTDGVVTTNSNKVYVASTAHDAISGYSSGSFINGNLRRSIATNTDIYEFPLGHGGTASSDYHPADIVNNNLTGVSYIDASVNAISEVSDNIDGNISTSQGGQNLTGVDETAEWNFIPDGAPTGGTTYGVRLYVVNTSLSATDDDKFFLVKRSDGSTTYADWDSFEGSTAVPTASGAGRVYNSGNGYAQRTGYTGFSKHAIAAVVAVLPIELLNFDAVYSSDREVVDVTWVTASETNNDYFTIEKSADGIDFIKVVQVPGAGNSNSVLSYEDIDLYPYIGISYYRLKQTDNDGQFEYSDLVAVNVIEVEDLKIWPNPATDFVEVSFDTGFRPDADKSVTNCRVNVYSAEGQLVYKKEYDGSTLSNLKIDVSGLNPGLYIVALSMNGQTYQIKFNK